MRKNFALRALAALAVMLLAVACAKEKEREIQTRIPGTTIRFGASTSWFNGTLPGTRTEYSGLDENGNAVNKDSGYERIDWVAKYDQIRILCEAAADGPTADYALNETPTVSAQKSLATIENKDKNGLKWATGDHYFYAMYPVPGMSSNYDFGTETTVDDANAVLEATTVSGGAPTARISGVVPAEQHAVRKGNEYKANMNYAYMYAATLVKEADVATDVTLSFNPLVTMFEITLKRVKADPMNLNLTKIELSGETGAQLSGSFQADLSIATDGTPNVGVNVTGTPENKVTLLLPTEEGATVPGIKLTDNPIKVNLLTLPVEQKNLTLTLYFGANNLKRTLQLKDASLVTAENPEGWVVAPARKKVYFNNIGVPATVNWVYTLDVTGDLIAPLDQAGGSFDYTVASYKTSSMTGSKERVVWVADFSDDGENWSDTPPIWLSGFTKTGPGIGEGESPEAYSATTAENQGYSEWNGSTSSVATTQSNARDLSCYNIYGAKWSGAREGTPYNTANCYVVSAPGWYRFPCVYGNAFKNGVDNPSAYTGPSSGDGLITGGFLNHADAHITKPWIKDNGVTINGASLLWQDTKDVITNIAYSDNYIYFYVNPAKISQSNAMIAAKSGSTTVWSWHIWIMDNPRVNLDVKAVYSSPYNPGVINPAYMLTKSIGFCDGVAGKARPRNIWIRFTQQESGNQHIIVLSQSGEASFNCTYYQWGRKDPMRPGVLHVGEDKPNDKDMYDINGNTIPVPDPIQGPVSVGTSIQHPDVFYMSDGEEDHDYNWTYRYDNLWNANVVAKATQVIVALDLEVKKTIYDPCPPGFKMPHARVYTGFTKTGYNLTRPYDPLEMSAYEPSTFETSMGYYFYVDPTDESKGTIFFHRTGSRKPETGIIAGVNVFGDFTTAAPIQGTMKDYTAELGGWTGPDGPPEATIIAPERVSCSYFTFGNNYMKPLNANFRGYGFPAHAIQE